MPVVKRWWWLVAAATLVSACGALFIASHMTRIYESEARVLVGPIDTDRDRLLAAGQLAQTYAELAESQPVLQATAERLDLKIRVGTLSRRVSASANEITRLLSIRASDEDPVRAATIANDIADSLTSKSINGLEGAGLLTVVDRAVAPRHPAQPNVPLITVLAAVASLVVALGAVIAVERLRDRVASEDEVLDLVGAEALGTLGRPDSASARTAPIVVEDAAHSRLAHAYRLLAAKVQVVGAGKPVQSILVVGARAADIANDVGVNLASAMAAAGWDVLLMDDDPEGGPSALLGVEPQPGALARLYDGDAVELQAVTLASRRELFVLPHDPAGRGSVTAKNARELLETQRGPDRVTVIAGGALQRSSDSVVWAGVVDAVLLVLDLEESRRRDLRQAGQALRAVTTGTVGTVMYTRSGRRPAPRARPVGSGGSAKPGGMPVTSTSYGNGDSRVTAAADRATNPRY